ncbi:MAG: hypothetical protein K1000chlam4_00977 [Chlamydiae bacterium]|nr:hypothetical protein [Chlamydiota bacterium]
MKQFFSRDIWRYRLDKFPKLKACWIRCLRIFILIIQGFTKRQIQQGASALTYYTLLALVPMVALILAVARGFLFEKALESWVLERFSERREIISKIIEFADASLQQTTGGVLATIGVVILFWSAIKILRNTEMVMNRIWEVKWHRSLARQFSDYLALILICPVVVVATSAVTIYLSARFSALDQQAGLFKDIGPILLPILNLVPLVLTSLLFTFVYIFMPNTRVKLRPALYAGVLTAIAYQMAQWLYLYFQIGMTKYNAIYGTFAALPLFLIWVHLSWVIVLLGSKVAFAFQNVDAYEFITEEFSLSHHFRKILCLRIINLSVKQFCQGLPPLSKIELSNKLSIPLLLTNELLYELIEGEILSRVKRDEDRESGYQPARSVDQLTIKQVLDMIEERGESIPLPPSSELETILKSLEAFSQQIEGSDANILLKDI